MADTEPTSILVVDDLPEKLLVYRTILDELNLTLVTATSGEEALRAVLNHDFAVILLDVNMPGMNGLETASFIRRRRRSAHTPIIFVTAFADEVRAAEGYAQGAVDYITTPLVPGILRAKVRVFADLYRMTQQVRRQAEERIALAEERTKREAAEETNRRLSFLAAAGAVLGQSLKPEVTAHDVVRLPLPVLADTAILVTTQPDGKPGQSFSARVGADGRVAEEVREWVGSGQVESGLAGAVERALSSGVASEPGPVLAIPLRARGEIFAVLGLSRRPSGRIFTQADRSVADAFASRAAIALENARLYHDVQQADRQKNEFLSMLAHELRNPLAPIRNANEVLGQQASNPARVRWAQGVIDRQLTHLVRLVDDLLDVSRLTLGKIRFVVEPVELAAIVTQALEAVRPLVDQAGHELKVSLPPGAVRLAGDKARLTQVVTNLLNNAAKYTEPGGRIWLTATIAKDEGGTMKDEPKAEPGGPGSSSSTVEIRVRDTGIGIAADLVPKVFDLFTQANRSLDRSQGGLGVGLTLVRRLVEMHGGSVEAFSEGPGRGSEFVVRLPVTPDGTSPAEPASTGDARAEATPLRIVVVDDNVDGADSLADLLAFEGHQVRTAYDGPAAIDAVRAFNPDVVLLDIGLPGMDGYEVARRLRGERASCPLLVAVSGYGRDSDRQRAAEAGFQHHFVKPVQIEALRGLLVGIRAASHAATLE